MQEVKITTYNSTSFIEGLDAKSAMDLHALLSFEKPGAKHLGRQYNFRPETMREYLFKMTPNKPTQFFPTGLLCHVQNYLNENGIYFKLMDMRVRPESAQSWAFEKKLPFDLRYYQKEIVETCLAEGRGTVEAATGCGKQMIILELVRKLSLNTLIVVPTSNLLSQTGDIFSYHFGKKRVGLIGSTRKQYGQPITVATYQSLPTAPKEFWDKQEVMIQDESHHGSNNTIQGLNENQFSKIYHRYFFTATNFRADGSDLALAGVSGKRIYHYPVTRAIREGILTKPIFAIYEFKHDGKVFDDWRKEVKANIIQNEKYHDYVSSIARRMLDQNIPTILFVTEIEHGLSLQKRIPGSVFVNGTKTGTVNMTDINAFNAGEIKCIIGTSTIGEGVDTVKAGCGIFADSVKAKTTVVQRIGRILRKSDGKDLAYIIDFRHRGAKTLTRHAGIRRKIYDEYESDIIYET